ncbi:MAG: cell wall-binding repeat-containing protein [Coriobacteriia bacterium]|nr:cell wall-binding repeat-containing protein [Coriobacteriia bacterium]
MHDLGAHERREMKELVFVKRAFVCVLAVALLAIGPLGSAGALTTADYPQFYLDRGPLKVGTLQQQSPEIEGEIIVYQYRNAIALPPDDSSWNIAVHNLWTGNGTNFPIIGSDQTNPDVAAGRVVYESSQSGNGDIYVRDLRDGLAGGTSRLIGGGTTIQARPRISASHVVWKNLTDSRLEYWDFAMETMSVVPESTGVEHWDVDGDTVVFSVAGNPQDTLYSWRLGEMDLPKEVYPGWSPLVGYPSIEHVRLHAMRVYIQLSGTTSRTALIDLRWRSRSDIAVFSQQTRPNLFDRSLVFESWQTDPNANRALNFLIHGVNSHLDVTNDPTKNFTRPSLFGNRLVYQEGTSGNIWMATDKPRVDRTEGPDRYATAVEISRAYYPDGPVNGWDGNAWSSYTVVICTGENFPDALAATPWAAQMGAPLLLTRGATLPPVVSAELDRLKPWRVVIVGGTDVVSQGVAAAIEAKGVTIDRVAGTDRYATSVEIAKRYGAQLDMDGIGWDKGVFVARGDAFPDALAAGPAAAGMHWPILLTRPDRLPKSVDDWFFDVEIEDAVIIGGVTAVSTHAKAEVDSHLAWMSSPPSERWYGDDRYATAARIARNAYYLRALDFDMIGIATGENFPDALGGGAACGYYGSPLLLTRNASVPTGLSDFLTNHEYAIGRGDIFGGDDVVTEGVRTEIRSKLK